jgi:glucosamine--fructose-6-phosphate aminotransferase (isomerizing)
MDDKGGFPHYMLKEIFEQPQGLRDTILPRLSSNKESIQLDTVRLDEEMRTLNRINIVASGTSRHAGMAGQFMIQELANVPVDVDYASEFEYRNPLIGRGELTIVITQSGETADTLAAQREAKAKHSKTIAISNVEGSTIAREADGVLYTFAGQEISIASTKAFTAQMAVLFMLAAYLGKIRGQLDQVKTEQLIHQLLQLPSQTEKVLECSSQVSEIAEQYHLAQDFLFLGRAIHYPVAMDGALKLKEVSYIHAEGYPTGETKHGPNALIDYSVPVVIIATCDREDAGSLLRYEKTVSNIRGFKQQSGSVIAIASEGDDQIAELADHTIFLPQASELLSPILEIIPLQLFAYYVAVRRGLDVDRPRNLVKSVNVE